MIKQIFTKNAPEAIGCYSQAVQYDKLLFSSGQIPVNPENGEIVSGGIVPQAEQLFFHLGNGKVFESVGSLDDLFLQLKPYGNFLRPHRSFLVNMDYIQNISYRAIKLISLAEIPIPHGKCSEIKNKYLEYAFNRKQVFLS